MVYNEYNPEIMRRAAARLGLLAAGIWTVSFLIVVLNFPSLLSEMGYIIGLLSIWMIGRNVRNFKKYIMPMNWSQGFFLCILSFMGGTLIFTLVQYLYFAYVDHGAFLGMMLETANAPEMAQAMKEGGNEALLTQVKDAITQMNELTPRELTIQLFGSNMMIAFIFSLLASLVGGIGASKPENNS